VHSPELGLWPLCSTKAHRQGHNREREGGNGEPGSGITGVQAAMWRPGDGGETVAERKLGNGGARASEEGESEMGEVW
jgi:hypothetical protein